MMNKLTPKQVSELSNENLTEGIAKFLGWPRQVRGRPNDGKFYVGYIENVETPYVFNPLNNWNDLMPLTVAHDIEYFRNSHISNKIKEYQAYCVNPRIKENDCTHINLKRALAECLFLVLQEKTNNE